MIIMIILTCEIGFGGSAGPRGLICNTIACDARSSVDSLGRGERGDVEILESDTLRKKERKITLFLEGVSIRNEGFTSQLSSDRVRQRSSSSFQKASYQMWISV